jgi:hypothetical protein
MNFLLKKHLFFSQFKYYKKKKKKTIKEIKFYKSIF